MDFKEYLTELADKVTGVKVVSFCGVDGIGIDTIVMSSDIETMETEVETSMMLKTVNELAKKMDMGIVNSFFFETEELVGILERCADDYFIILFMSPDGNLGRARFEAKKLSRKIETQLNFGD
jgi:predicted regulator of Ras-like GTPase activity (Roadblock/LC7/MglB family)